MKISALTAATTPLSGAELFPIVQSGNTRRVSLNDLLRSIGNGTAAAPALAPGGDPNTGIYFPAADTIGFVEGGVEVMRIDANGRVGINTLTPSARLDINTGASASAIVMQAASDTAAQMRLGVGANGGSAPAVVSTGNGLQLATTSASAITLFTNSVERLRLDASGNLGIGTTSALTRLHVRGTGGSSGVRLTLSNGGEIAALNDPLGVIDFYSDDVSVGASGVKGYLGVYNQFNGNWDGTLSRHATYMAFATSFDSVATERMRLDSAGNLGLGVTPSTWTSSYRIAQLGGYAAIGASTDVVVFANNWRDDGANKYLNNGFASQYMQFNGQHRWYTAPSGTAGAAITFTQAMTLDANGNLLVGTTSIPAGQRLRIAGGDVGLEGQYLYLVNANASIQLGAAQNSRFTNTDSTNTLDISRTGASSVITLSTAGAERARVKAEGQVRFVPLAAAPTTSVQDGDVYYDSGTNKLRVRAAGAWVDLH